MGLLKRLFKKSYTDIDTPQRDRELHEKMIHYERLSRTARMKEIREETRKEYEPKVQERRAKTETKYFGKTKGWQLTFTANFMHTETWERRGPYECFSLFHKKFNYSKMFAEAQQHGESQAQGSYDSAAGDADWIMFNVKNVRKIRYNP